MDKLEKSVVIGGLVVASMVAGGFSLSQGSLADSDDSYQSPPEEIVMSEQENTSNEIEIQDENTAEIVINDTYDINREYNKDDIIVYNGQEYKAKWYTKGEDPEQYVDWEEVVALNEDGSENYARGKHYLSGDIVVYEGNKYEAKWWTESVPGSNDSWMITKVR